MVSASLWNTSGEQGISGVLHGINLVTDGLFGASIVLLVWLLIYFRLRNEPTREAVIAASFTAFIIAVILSMLGTISDWVFNASLIVFIGSLVMLLNRE
jgi:hypothetical protein